MKTRLNKAIIVLCMLLGGGLLWGQTAILTPSIQLNIQSMSGSTTDLTWASPSRVNRCFIEYTDSSGTTSYPVANFSTNTTTIPRNPLPGPFEHFKIVFIDSVSFDSLYHEAYSMNMYGGIVLIEEEIFVKTTVGLCKAGNPAGVTDCVIQPGCYHVEPGMMCTLASRTLANQGIDTSLLLDTILNRVNEVNFHDTMMSRITSLYLAGDTNVRYCGSTLHHIDKGKPFHQAPTQDLPIKLGPVPCYKSLNLYFSDRSKDWQLSLRVFSMSGRLVEEKKLTIPSGDSHYTMPTLHWPDGMYSVQLLYEGRQEQVRILKQKK